MTNISLNSTEINAFSRSTIFLKTIFNQILANGQGDIEIRTFNPANQYFINSIDRAVNTCNELSRSKIDAYFGVNPRTGKGGKKANVHFVTVFHAEIDYGQDGHKKNPVHETYETALDAINKFSPTPSMVIHSGGGFHCYWVLETPLNVQDTGLTRIESINRNLSEALGGDTGTQDISRVLRIPGTFNFKLPDNPRLVEAIYLDGPKYRVQDFEQFMDQEKSKDFQSDTSILDSPALKTKDSHMDIEKMPVSEKIKFLILNGNDGSYPSRSEADMAVVAALVNRGVQDQTIKEIFEIYPIGEKYRTHAKPDAYLQYTIQAAKKLSNLTEAELQNPLFTSGALIKKEKGYSLEIVPFQEYIFRKHKLIVLEQEKRFFKFNGKCYEECSEESINKLCQEELKNHRRLFSKPVLNELIHFAIGDKLVNSDDARISQLRYLTLQNGLYDLNKEYLINHTPEIFTTNLLPYNYDSAAQCPRFTQYLKEVFMDDQDKINFVQEAIGYAFHKSIPTPAVFFLIGEGCNGKSVLTNILVHLFGEGNASSISLNSLNNEYYILTLFGKMINISSETPQRKQVNTDVIKNVVAGDWISGREPYKQPVKFRPYAKHYLAMNELPDIQDNTHGMWRRIYVIEFPRIFSKDDMDTGLTEKLLPELPGIFNWSLEGYKRLREKEFRFEVAESMRMAKTKYRIEKDSVLAFINEKIKKGDEKDKLKLSEVYEKYCLFCKSENYKNIEKKVDFRKTLEKSKYRIANSTQDQNQVFIFGAKLNED